MKKLILFELLRTLKMKPRLMRKVKIFAVVGVVGFLLTTTVVIWAGISALSFVAGKATEVIHSPQTVQQMERLGSEVKELPRLQALNCWGKAQSLMAVEPWLSRPALDNLRNLKVACLEQQRAVCEGHECAKMKELMKTAEGRTI